MSSPDTFTSSPHPWLALYGKGANRGHLISRGKRRTDLVGLASPLTNGMIREKNNLEFFLNCVGPRETAHIYWDEYFHGARASMYSYFAKVRCPGPGCRL